MTIMSRMTNVMSFKHKWLLSPYHVSKQIMYNWKVVAIYVDLDTIRSQIEELSQISVVLTDYD